MDVDCQEPSDDTASAVDGASDASKVSETSVEQSPEEKRAAHYTQLVASQSDSSDSTPIEDTALSSSSLALSSDVDLGNINNSNLGINCSNVVQQAADDATISSGDSQPAEQTGAAQSMKSQLTLDIAESSSNPVAVHCDTPIVEPKDVAPSEAVQSPESFTSFMYWRDPLPEIDIATELSPTDESGDEAATVIEDCLQNRQQAGDGSAASSDQNSAGSGDSKQGQSVTKLEDIQLADAANTDELDHFLSDFKLGKVCALDLCVSL